MTYLLIALGVGFVAMLIGKVFMDESTSWSNSKNTLVRVLADILDLFATMAKFIGSFIIEAIVLGVLFYLLLTGC